MDDKLALMGVVKETGVDDVGLMAFYVRYFNFPLYKDGDWKLYKSMGNRKISLAHLVTGTMKAFKRFKAKDIEGTYPVGDGWLQGGVLIFDKLGNLRFVQNETYGDELDIIEIRRSIEIRRTIERARKQGSDRKLDRTESSYESD